MYHTYFFCFWEKRGFVMKDVKMNKLGGGGNSLAFSLAEILLAIVAIPGFLIALLLPTVQIARESAWRTRCTIHLNPMALGVRHSTRVGTHALPPFAVKHGRASLGGTPLSSGVHREVFFLFSFRLFNNFHFVR
jgi:hypothetical protein